MCFRNETVGRELAIVPMDDTQASLQILRLSAVSHMLDLLHTVPSSITHEASRGYVSLAELLSASIIARDGAVTTGLPTPKEVAYGFSVCRNKTYLGHEQAHLPLREGGL